MIVYGDAVARENLRAKQGRAALLLDQSADAGIGIVRHGLLASALIEMGELVQALCDARFVARGRPAASEGLDAHEDLETALMSALRDLAAALGRSWDGSFAQADPAGLRAAIQALPIPDVSLDVRYPEGFAHYALYPEAYWSAARCLAPRPDALVIGLRSIGTTLAATVAAALGTGTAVTVRPVGHPFQRSLKLSPALAACWAEQPGRLHAVVDEGPGLSGSSFGAVADRLEALGVAQENIAFFPGHAGDLGAEASSVHRARWRAGRRLSLSFADLAGPTAPPHQQLDAWVADLTGAPTAPLDDLSAGGWRAALLPAHVPWPPVDAQNEKLKFRLRTANGAFLLRFVGLGRRGHAKLGQAQVLAAAGFGVSPLGWRHGFLLEPWLGDARLLRAGDPRDRAALLPRLGAYLGLRADRFPAGASGGATPAALLAMAHANVAEALGPAAAARLDRWTPADLARLAAAASPILVDGRLQPWEWLARPDGTILKTDALDHHAAHDLVGAQDVAWDIAGARVEWSLSARETAALVDAVERRSGRSVDPGLLELFGWAYPAFQLGSSTMAAGRAAAEEASRLLRHAAVYRTELEALLAASST